MDAASRILLDLVVLLVAAKLAGELFERLRQPAVLGELLVGIVVGPSLLGLIDFSSAGAEIPLLEFVASFGVILLLLEVGLDSNLDELMSVGRSASLVAALGMVGAFALGYAASWELARLGFQADDPLRHVFVGAALTATSVGITARVLADLDRLGTPEARIILGAAVLDDVGGLLVLAIVVSLFAGVFSLQLLAVKAALAIGFLVVAVALGRKLVPPLVAHLARFRVRGVLVAIALAFALALAFVAQLVGLAAIVGAFAGGLVLAQSKEHVTIRERIRPLADVFVPFFFVSFGLRIDLHAVSADAPRIAIAAGLILVAALVGKLLAGFGVVDRGVSRASVAIGMIPRGEVGLIFALYGLTDLHIPLWLFTALLLVVAATTFLAPPWLSARLGRRPKRSELADVPSAAIRSTGER
ncbi:MAG: cation:proton antiporter [Thermoplasmatota archaeon]